MLCIEKNDTNIDKKIKWSENEIDILKKNYNKMLFSELSKLLDRTEGALRAKCFDLNLCKKSPWSQDEIDFVKNNYMEMSTLDIAKILNRTKNAVQIKARRLGLKKYPYTCNYNYFDDISTEEQAYWLGFLFADGWISKNKLSNAGVVGVELQYSDINHLKKFNKSISGNYNITDRWRRCTLGKNINYNKKHLCTLRIFSLTMYNSLEKLGFTNENSYKCKIPQLKENLIKHFIRGFFDGDGCICYTNKTFKVFLDSASIDFINDFLNFLKIYNINYCLSSTINEFNTQIYRIEIYKKIDKVKFLDLLYKDSNIYLDRKYKKYLKIKSTLQL